MNPSREQQDEYTYVSVEEWHSLVERTYRSERALRRVLGLLARRRWWNDNVWAAQEIAKDALLGVWDEDEDAA